MAARVSIIAVRQAWADYVKIAGEVGFDTTGWNLQEGSAVQGVHYSGRTGTGDPVPGAMSNGFNSAFLGTTQGETFDALRHMIATLRAVAELRN
jgi:hypothetical protein